MEPYKSKTAFLIVLSLLVAALVSPPVGACDWPNWRGPDYNGISGESDWNASWPDSGPKVLWKASIGTGFSSISVSNGKAYATGNTASKKDKSKGENDIIFCFDAETGEEIWSYKYANQLDPKYYEGGTLATPTVSGGKVYNVSKDGKTFCLDADTGKVVWQADLLADFGVERPKWGISGSPFVINKMVIFNAGSAGLALNKEDGSLIWKSSAGPGGYSTAMPFTIDGKKCIVLAGMKDILALD
ncbi:MAG: PQQ-like beta-propeller repeat protein, partial [Planctomycetes bacterium]|nr:PQQ-like beta-propeller repeat protein [Planctomycetota bacterium]